MREEGIITVRDFFESRVSHRDRGQNLCFELGESLNSSLVTESNLEISSSSIREQDKFFQPKSKNQFLSSFSFQEQDKFFKPKPKNQSVSGILDQDNFKNAEPNRPFKARFNPSRQVLGSDASQRSIQESIAAQKENGWIRVSNRRFVKTPLSLDLIKQRRLCYRCGLGDHMAYNCRNNRICYFCRRPGHEAKFCFQNPDRIQDGDGRGRQQEIQMGVFRRGQQAFQRFSGDDQNPNFQFDNDVRFWGQGEGRGNDGRAWVNKRHENRWREANPRHRGSGLLNEEDFPPLRFDQGQRRYDKGKRPMISAELPFQKKIKGGYDEKIMPKNGNRSLSSAVFVESSDFLDVECKKFEDYMVVTILEVKC